MRLNSKLISCCSPSLLTGAGLCAAGLGTGKCGVCCVAPALHRDKFALRDLKHDMTNKQSQSKT